MSKLFLSAQERMPPCLNNVGPEVEFKIQYKTPSFIATVFFCAVLRRFFCFCRLCGNAVSRANNNPMVGRALARRS